MMGGALQRIEILLVGLVLLLAGGLVALLLLVRPPSPAAYLAATPRPVQLSTPGVTPAPAAVVPTAAPVASPVPATAVATEIAAPTSVMSTPVATATSARPHLALTPPAWLPRVWPWLLLALGVLGLLWRGLRARQRLLARLRVLRRPTTSRIGIRWPTIPRNTLRWPALPHWRVAPLRFPHRRAVTVATTPALENAPAAPVVPPAIISPQGSLGLAALDTPPPVAMHALDAALAAQTVVVPAEIALEQAAHAPPDADAGSAEDRALALAAVLATLWQDAGLSSPVLALDTPLASGAQPVVVTLDPAPADEAALAALPDQLAARPGWRAHWRSSDTLLVELPAAIQAAPGGPLLVPLLDHGRGNRTTRFFPLAAWRHLGLYGGQALPALHALLSSLLYAQPPAALALTILDHGEISPLYREVAHLVPAPESGGAPLDQLVRILRRPHTRSDVRPLLLVVVEPDSAQLSTLTSLLTRLRSQPSAPVHLLVVQERLLPAGHELYATLPALITSGGHGSAPWLAAPHAWPRTGSARFVARTLRIEGRPRLLDEAAIAALLVAVRGTPAQLPPVLWDAELPATTALEATPTSAPQAPSAEWDDAPRRIALRIVTERQRLIDQEDTHGRNLPHLTDTTPPALEAAPSAGTAVPTDAPVETAAPTSADQAVVTPNNNPAPAPQSEDTDEDGAASWISELLTRDTLPRAEQRALLTPARPIPTDGAPAPASAAPEPENGWPCGPAPLGRVALADLLARVVSADEIIAGDPNNIGVTKNRLISLLGLPKASAKELAETLLVWFDQAGLLVEPTRPGGRLRHPRPLHSTDLTTIAAQLTATPLPDAATVAAAWAGTVERST